MIQVHVGITPVRVQVPPTALPLEAKNWIEHPEQLWRNWHTRMIQVHVSITLVRVQVPPTALKGKEPNLISENLFS